MKCPYRIYYSFCPYELESRFPVTSNPLTVSTVDSVEKNEKISQDLKIPVFQGQINATILSSINQNIKNDIMEFKSQMDEAAEEHAEEMKKLGKKIIPIQVSNTYIITYNKNNILSISVIYQEVIDGRNYFIRVTYNYDLNTGDSLSLKNLFKPNSNYIQVLNKKIREKIQANKQAYFPNTLEKFKGIAEDQPYYLENNNLDIFFKFNEIAPVAADIPVIKLPLSELRDILKPQLLRNF